MDLRGAGYQPVNLDPADDIDAKLRAITSLVGLQHVLAQLLNSTPRRIAFPQLMREQHEVSQIPKSAAIVDQFVRAHPAEAQRAEVANIISHPQFVAACARVLAAEVSA